MLDIKTLETWLWDAACSIRGAVDAPKFKDYILPLIFVKRISDVFEDELKRLSDEFGDEKVAYDLARKDHKLVRFFIPRSSTWPEIRKKTKNKGWLCAGTFMPHMGIGCLNRNFLQYF